MIFVYRRRNSDSAKLLADGLEGDRVKIFNNGTFQRREGGVVVRPRRNDVIVCWGEDLPPIAGVRVLNNAPLVNKMVAAQRLKAAGVETVEVSATRPRVVPAAPRFLRVEGGQLYRAGAQALIRTLQEFVAQPDPIAAPVGEWLPRTFNHIGGHDLMTAPAAPDYYSKKENIVEEYRLHMFNGKSIRAGKKGAREGVRQHPWIRSYDAGWGINYAGFNSTKAMRTLAAKAVETLGLQFGAVDMGKKQNGDLIVLEVNRAPGLEGGTVTSYVNAISAWAEGA